MDPNELANILQFRPPIWWDPVPDWIWRRLEDVLDKRVLVELAAVQIEAQQAALQAQLDALGKTAGLLRQGFE
jgi:hypothetical protein